MSRLNPRLIVISATCLAVVVACSPRDPDAIRPLSDEEFWQLSEGMSEPPGSFEHADNLVSNEALFAQLAQMIRRRGGAYIGVGPEQNFSYVARLQPAIAFVVDIRQDNRNLHLMYKALFEMSADRVEFVARLFSRERPSGLSRRSSVFDLFTAIDTAKPSPAMVEETRRLLRLSLVETHLFPLSASDLHSMDEALRAFHTDGPAIRYGRSLPPSATRPSYRRLMTGRDLRGNPQSYLASEDTFAFVKDLHSRNLIVPIVGDFAGPHAITRMGEYIRQHGQVVSVFYASNVEVYLTRDQRRTFCGHLAALPHDETTLFIGNRRLQPLESKLQACARIAPSLRWP
jgi:hypothetical protein